MRGSWRRRHETTAVIRTTLERAPTPSSAFLDGEPAGITLAVDRRPRDKRPRTGPWRLHRRSLYVAGAPFDADPRRSESRRRNPVGIVDAVGVADYRAEAHSNAAPRANAHSYGVSEADPHAVADAYTYIAPDSHADGHPDPYPNGCADAHANGHPHAYPYPDSNADAYPDTNTNTSAHPRTRRG